MNPKPARTAAKRDHPSILGEPKAKKLKKLPKTESRIPDHVDHPILSHYYDKVLTLRGYLINQLPRSSRIRKKKIALVGRNPKVDGSYDVSHVVEFLDTTFVGIPVLNKADDAKENMSTSTPNSSEEYRQLRADHDKSEITLLGLDQKDSFSQDDIVNFCIWKIFQKTPRGSHPPHILCEGFERTAPNIFERSIILDRSIPGLLLKRRNEHMELMKKEPWQQILTLLGKSGEDIMVKMILECGVYMTLQGTGGNIFQLSGTPLNNLFPISKQSTATRSLPRNDDIDDKSPLYTPAQIFFCRHRMMYGKAAISSKGRVKTGFRHIHALNRCSMAEDLKKEIEKPNDPDAMDMDEFKPQNYHYGDLSTLKIMAHMFPRQFDLHNVFTSRVDSRFTAQKFQDYTMRDTEIKEKFGRSRGQTTWFDIKIPKRLRGEAHRLIWRMQVLHKRCSYWELLRHYCPTTYDHYYDSVPADTERQVKYTLPLIGQARPSQSKPQKLLRNKKPSRPLFPRSITLQPGETITSYATPTHQVSAFCRAVIANIVPCEFWGTDTVQKHNLAVILRSIHRFVSMGRFERMYLHDVVQGIKFSDIPWLAKGSLRGNSMSLTDRQKRLELLQEFVYYVFDSLLIPLIRSNFYATETNIDRNSVIFFRHDIWRALVEPQVADLKSKMFQEVKIDDARKILARSRLGYSTLRLLPKATSMRPIMNLKCRQQYLDRKTKQARLGSSINSELRPLHSVIKFEKTRQPEIMGSTLSSVEDIYVRLRQFVTKLSQPLPRLYFVKVDFQAAFDTIPQREITELLRSIPKERDYHVYTHVEAKPGSKIIGPDGEVVTTAPMKKFCQSAKLVSDHRTFKETIEQMLLEAEQASQPLQEDGDVVMTGLPSTVDRPTVMVKRNIAFHGSIIQRSYPREYLLKTLLETHINRNMVKIGKKLYTQKQGIPQGSVLSTDLCNLFYAHMESQELTFLQSDSHATDHLLMRLIDDSLLITTNKDKAVRFAKIMIRGLPTYGASANPHKTLVNFPLRIRGVDIPRANEAAFPFCGTTINCRTLSVGRLRERRGTTLMVENRRAGQNFQKRVLNLFRVQAHAMFYDCTHNSMAVVQRNLRGAVRDVAERAWEYIRTLPQEQRPSGRLVIRTISKLAEVVHLMLKSPAKKTKFPGYSCDIPKAQIMLYILEAFGEVFRNKQDKYREIKEWLHVEGLKAASMAANLSKTKIKALTQRYHK